VSTVAKSSIYDKIEQKSKADADAIIREGQERAASIRNSMLREAKEDNAKILAKTQERIDEQLKAAKTEFEQKARQVSLQNKKNLIAKALEYTLEKLRNMDDASLFDFIVKKINEENLDGNELIQVSKADHEKYLNILSSGKKDGKFYVLDKLNDAVGKEVNFHLDTQYANINGGFLIIGEKFDLNFSFESVVNNFKNDNEVEIANILFNEGK